MIGNPANPPTIRLAVVSLDPGDPGAVRPRTLTIAGGASVRFEGVRFELADGPARSAVARSDAPVGLAVTGPGNATLTGCRFEPAAGLEAAAVTGLAVTAPSDNPSATTVAIEHCYFAVRQTVAVRLTGPVRATVTESAFAPHQASFALRTPYAARGGVPGTLVLRHCSFLLDQQGAVAEAEDAADWRVSAGYCVFATPPTTDPGMAMARIMGDGDAAARAAVLRVKAGSPEFADARYDGRADEANVYYNVDPFATLRRGYTLDEYRATGHGGDPAGVVPADSPWAAGDTAAELDRADPWLALRLKLTRAVRVDRDEVIVGVRSLPGPQDKLYYPWPPPFTAEPAANPRVKVWWPGRPPGEPDDTRANVFRRLDDALARLGPDDELLVRGNGDVPIPMVVVDKKLTVKPYRGSAPVLVPADPGQRSLFHLAGGELVLDGLSFRLPTPAASDPPRKGVVAAVAGGRKFTLRDCVVTLAGRPADDFAAVSLSPLADADAAAGGVRLELDQCLVRGRGRAVWVKAARRFDLTATNTVAALTGPLLTVDPGVPNTPADAASVVRLSRLTAVLAGPLIDLRVSTPGGPAAGKWVPLKVDADECVFAATGAMAGTPLVVVSGVGTPDNPGQYLSWQSARPNWYPDRETAVFLRLTATDTTGMPELLLAATEWFAFTGEDRAKSLGTVKFARRPTVDRLAEAVPDDVAITTVDVPAAEAIDAGAEIGEVARPPADAPE